MDRRDAIKNVALMMGGTLIGAQAMMSCEPSDQAINSLFMESELRLMEEIAETIIPATDTPGAKEAGVGAFMAMMVLDCYTPEHQQIFKEGLASIQKDFKKEMGTAFLKANGYERNTFLTKLDQKAKEYAGTEEAKEKPHYFRMMKELTLLGFFTSETGATKTLRYVESPGRYDGCMDYKPGDKVWAT